MFRLAKTISTWVFAAFLAGSFATRAGAHELPDFTKLVEDNGPAVVNIGTMSKKSSRVGGLPRDFQIPDIPEDSPLHDFFKKFLGPDANPGQREPSESLGSGLASGPRNFLKKS